MGQTIYPGVPKIVSVTVLNGQTTGTAKHHMGTTPSCGRPNPNTLDNVGNAYATADETDLTVTCEVPVSQDTVFKVMVIV